MKDDKSHSSVHDKEMNGFAPTQIELRPLEALDPSPCDIALIILNTPFDRNGKRFQHLWKRAVVTACVDGAATRLHSCGPIDDDEFIPDYVTGDFDSAVEDTLDYYRAKGSKIISTPDQDLTDFTKCVNIVTDCLTERGTKVDSIVVMASFGEGRFDHVMGNLNTLFLASQMTEIPLYIYTAESLICLLKQGKYRLDCGSVYRGEHCGLVPVGEPCDSVTTSGLRWNMDKESMRFGGLVSTSNMFVSDKVTVETSSTVLWTMSIKPE